MKRKKKDNTYPAPFPPPEKSDTNPEVDVAIIGPCVKIRGEISGKEDLTVNGQVDGNIDFKQSQITIGRTGNIKADIHGKTIIVEGKVQGNLVAEEKIVLQPTGNLRGSMTAPRVNVEDGAKFKGNVDMGSIGTEKKPKLKEVPKEAPVAEVHDLAKKPS